MTRRVRGPRPRTHPSRTLAHVGRAPPVSSRQIQHISSSATRGGAGGAGSAARDATRRGARVSHPPESCAFSLEKGPPRGRRARPRRRPRVRSGSRERTHRCRDPAPRTWSASDPCWGRRASSRPSRSRAGAARRQPVAANDGGDFRGTRLRGATRRERARRIRGDDARSGARGGGEVRARPRRAACVRGASAGRASVCARRGRRWGKVLIRAIFARRARVARRQESRRRLGLDVWAFSRRGSGR